MLVLTRKRNQSIVIGHGSLGNLVTIKLLEITKNHARIGFVADQSVPIVREELLLELPTQKAKAQEALDASTPSTQVAAEKKEVTIKKKNKNTKTAAENYLH